MPIFFHFLFSSRGQILLRDCQTFNLDWSIGKVGPINKKQQTQHRTARHSAEQFSLCLNDVDYIRSTTQ